MNVVREIGRINQAELDIAIKQPSASWHAQYADSAYIFVGGLPYELTEGDVVAIFSQYGEVVDVNLPRAANPTTTATNGADDNDDARASGSRAPPPVRKGKHRGFGFLMYEDQRSTVLAVDNLNGAQVLGRTLRVDHVASYHQPKTRDDDGQRVEPQTRSLNAAPPELLPARAAVDADEADEDLEDPMAAYLQRRRREDRDIASDGVDDADRAHRARDKEERRRRKEERAAIRAERERRRHHGHHHDRRDHRSDKRYESDDQAGGNRYARASKQRSVLDDDPHDQRRRHRPPSRSPSPPPRGSSSRPRRRSRSPSRSPRR